MCGGKFIEKIRVKKVTTAKFNEAQHEKGSYKLVMWCFVFLAKFSSGGVEEF
jgi:hypothetical protein